MALAAAYPEDRVTLREVGLRDGLQLVKAWPSTPQKLQWLTREHAAGVTHFEIGSFLPASRAPQFADIRDLLAFVKENAPGIHASALAMNERGIDDALSTSAAEIACVVSATEEHNQANIRRSLDQAIGLVRYAAARRDELGHHALISVGIAMAFGCSISGSVRPSQVLRVVEACMAAGADLVGVADTVGFAGPDQVFALSEAIRKLVGSGRFLVHLHDTRGMGIANAYAGLEMGVNTFDAAVAGLGGCPFAGHAGAAGNVCTEDLVFMCDEMGIETGINLEALMESARLAEEIVGHPLPGSVMRGGSLRALREQVAAARAA